MMNRMRKVFKSKEGFTLIELMVVLAVLGILAAVAIPRFNDMRGKATLVKAKNELKQVQTALELYYAENNSYPAADATLTGTDGILNDYIISGDLTGYAFNYSKTTSDYEIEVTYDTNKKVWITRSDISDTDPTP